jgi:hypothetical protein
MAYIFDVVLDRSSTEMELCTRTEARPRSSTRCVGSCAIFGQRTSRLSGPRRVAWSCRELMVGIEDSRELLRHTRHGNAALSRRLCSLKLLILLIFVLVAEDGFEPPTHGL